MRSLSIINKFRAPSLMTVLSDSLNPTGFLDKNTFIFFPCIINSSCLPKAGVNSLRALFIFLGFTLHSKEVSTAAKVLYLLYLPLNIGGLEIISGSGRVKLQFK